METGDSDFVEAAEFHAHVPWCRARIGRTLVREACSCGYEQMRLARLECLAKQSAPSGAAPAETPTDDPVCQHGTALDVHCCNCHSGFIFDAKHECPPNADDWREAIETALGLEHDAENHTPDWAHDTVLAIREIGNRPDPLADLRARIEALTDKYDAELKRIASGKFSQETESGWVPALTLFMLLKELRALLGADTAAETKADAEEARIMAMTDAELYAEVRAEGRDPDQVAETTRQLLRQTVQRFKAGSDTGQED